MTQAGAAFFAILLRFYYGYQNSLKEKRSQELREQPEDNMSDDFKWGNCKSFSYDRFLSEYQANVFIVTDRENTRFRYVY